MSRVCHCLGKRTVAGQSISRRGKAKKHGGVGKKVTGITKRKFKPNIQRVRALVKGRPFQPEPLDIAAVIRDVLSFVRTDSADLGVVIELETDPRLPTVEGDRIQLEQVLVNLIRNGFDAMQDAPMRRLTVQAMVVEDGFLQVSVRDTGSGAGEQSLETLFDSFVTTKPEGMGMGLAISQTIMTNHHGKIRADSWPGKGSTFTIELPPSVEAVVSAAS